MSGGEDAQILVWDLATGSLYKKLSGDTNFINVLVYHPSGQLITGDEDNQITTWDVEKGKKTKDYQTVKTASG